MKYHPYPRYITDIYGKRRIVQNHLQEEEATGKPVNEDGTPRVVPTEAEVLARGYTPEAAFSIVARETAKAAEKSNLENEPAEKLAEELDF